MEGFFWGMFGGAIVMLVNKCKGLPSAAESADKNRHGILAKLKFCSSEAIENLRDLAAESKMEWEAEKAALDEVSLHTKKPEAK
ncbi:MAG: hypothetical protein H8E10_18505 [Desulfobacterales bacterium]|nr:hypothetical protein [Desulfobacterales bacterium]